MGDDNTVPVDSAAELGQRVRALRRSRGWTLDVCAIRSGVSRRTIVNVEKGTANAGLGVLVKLSTAFGVSLASLVESSAQNATHHTPMTLWDGNSGGTGRLVVSTEAPDVVELWQWRMYPGEQHSSEPHSVGTRELLYVHSGSVRIVVASRHHVLGPSDAFTFDGAQDHSYSCEGAEPTHFTLTVYQPGVKP